MPDLSPWLYAVGTIATALTPALWYGIVLYREVLRDNQKMELRLQAVEQELYGKTGDNGMKGRLAELGVRTHAIPTLKSVIQLIEDEHHHRQRLEDK